MHITIRAHASCKKLFCINFCCQALEKIVKLLSFYSQERTMKITDPNEIKTALDATNIRDSMRGRILEFVSGPYKGLDEMYSIGKALYVIGVLKKPEQLSPLHCDLIPYLNRGLVVRGENQCGDLIICHSIEFWAWYQHAVVYLGKYGNDKLVFNKHPKSPACLQTLGDLLTDDMNTTSYRFDIKEEQTQNSVKS